MSMKNLILLLLCISLFACRTPQQAAQRHLKKAIALNPNIIKEFTTDTTIKGIAEGIASITTPEQKGEFNFDCDSVKKALDEYDRKQAAIGLKPGDVLVHSDSTLDVSIKKDEATGKFKIKYVVKKQILKVPVKVPYEVKVRVPGKAVIEYVTEKFYTYAWFWVMLIIILLESFLLLKGSKPVIFIKEKLKALKK